MEVSKDYKLYLKFIDKYLPVGFKGIQSNDTLMQKIFELEKKNKQYFYFADMLQMKILYTSPSIKQTLGIEPSEYDPGIQFRGTHPDDQPRHSISRARMIQLCNDLYIKGGDEHAVMSTSMRYLHAGGHYINFIVQGYVFTAKEPLSTTYTLFINTDINWFGPIKHGYNYYFGADKSFLRYPDKALILTGCIFTDREFEILQLLKNGLSSEEIGRQIFISTHTVDTHRRNILKKTGKHNTSELIIDLQDKGFF